MAYEEFLDLLQHVGRDPSRLIFEDELTGIYNRRFLLSYFEHKIRWETQEDYPLSLLIIDLDRFKEVNDTLGHEVGDQALAWFGSLLKEVAGEAGFPIRFGGDEFVLLLPKADGEAARDKADRLLERTRDRPFRLRDTQVNVPITLSIGFATAPEDASDGRSLYHAADMALLHAKQSGRDRLAGAADIDPAEGYPKTALYRLKATGIAGRDEELKAVAEALQGLSRGVPQFVIFEAGIGMGKTTFLETVSDNLKNDENFCVVQVSGDPHEGYRPYYLTSRVLLALFQRTEDNGAAILEELTQEEVEHVKHLVPQLGEVDTHAQGRGASARRQAIFATLAKLLPLAAEMRPLVLLIDDLQFSDEATLFLLRTLIQTQRLKIFVCGCSPEFLHLEGDAEVTPLERFFSLYHRELGIRRVKLRPLEEGEISEYLRGVFPRFRVPAGFEAELAEITQGNPLFLGEIIRKLVLDRKVKLVDQEWVIEPLEAGYLPKSLDEILRGQIAALDDEGRQLLARASTIGERIPLSVLAGSSGLNENRILDLLDRAEALGLVKVDFEDNDAVMRFLGKEVQDVSYDTVDAERRRQLHEEVGTYQEGLYRQRLLASPSSLAHQFERAANEAKARHYGALQVAFNQTVFNPDEAAEYAGEVLEDLLEVEKRIAPENLHRIPQILRAFMSAVRTIQLYPPESVRIAQALAEVNEGLQNILANNEHLSCSQAQQLLLINGQRLDVSRFSLLASSFVELLARSELQAIVFHRGVTSDEIKSLLLTLSKLKPEVIDARFWRDVSLAQGLENIELRQVRYSRLRRLTQPTLGHQRLPDDQKLTKGELTDVPKILRAFQGALQNARFYPLDSFTMGRALQQFHSSLQGVLSRHPTLSLAAVDGGVLANGVKLDTRNFESLAASFRECMQSVGLRSVTFLSHIPPEELYTFIEALKHPPDDGYDGRFWDELAMREELTHLAFNQRDYKMGVYESLLTTVEVTGENGDEPEDESSALARRIQGEPLEILREGFPTFGRELIIKGKDRLLRQLIVRLFEDYESQDSRSREATVRGCRLLLDGLILGLQHKLTRPASDSLLTALSNERDPRILHEFGNLLHSMASNAIQFADYDTASRILLGIKEHQNQLEAEGDQTGRLARLLERRVDTGTQQLLKDDLKSGHSDRQARAAQVIGSLGRSAIPLLIDVIKEERDFRIRLLIAGLLSELGPSAGEQLKRSLITEVTVEQRFRILEVIDTVTQDLATELAYSVGDASPKIRRAAFKLFERLNDDRLIDIIIPLARDDDLAVAKGALRSLAHLRSPNAVRAITAVLEDAKEPKLAIACCQALGEIGHPAGIDALAQVLGQRKPPFFRKKWDEQVRATAVLALKQIPHSRAKHVLSQYADDSDLRVRLVARA